MTFNARPDLGKKAICNGHRGQIEWKDSCLRIFLADPDRGTLTDSGVKWLVWDWVKNQTGQIETTRETDPDWLKEHPDDPWWYFVVIPVPQFRRGLFVKVKLLWEDGDDEENAFVQIVSIHEQK